ncbi:hypothetical protein [Roseovarius gaetbuli]|uniref:hypothetical protein n=1 Tax=Roseovarius gaetbuli TaxID=1356575 RepID=UPI000A267557|nr:hypothetical protein [Roseovarius gaetbuli]
MLRVASGAILPHSPLIYARPLPETAFLVDAAAGTTAPATDWSDTLYAALARLKAQDLERSAGLRCSAAQGRGTA